MKQTFEVHQTVEIEYDESRFTPEFIEGFKRYMFPLEDTKEHLEEVLGRAPL